MQKPAVTLMVKAARAGGSVLLRNMHKLDALNVVEKQRMDYASEVDGLAEEAIVKELRKAGPEYAVLGEEGGHQPARGGRKARPPSSSICCPCEILLQGINPNSRNIWAEVTRPYPSINP